MNFQSDGEVVQHTHTPHVPSTQTRTDKTTRHSSMLQLAQHSTTVKYFIHNKVIFFFKKSFLIYNTIFDKTTPFTAKFELLNSSFSHNQSKHDDDDDVRRERWCERDRWTRGQD